MAGKFTPLCDRKCCRGRLTNLGFERVSGTPAHRPCLVSRRNKSGDDDETALKNELRSLSRRFKKAVKLGSPPGPQPVL